jgi:hypothetical protein
MPLYWGDIHNHNDLGYGVGSAQRSLEIARQRLDFWAPTPHGQVHGRKLATSESGFDDRIARGMRRVHDEWPMLQRLVQEANTPGQFVTFLGYEWHSWEYGDHVLYYPHGEGALVYFDDIPDLQAYARRNGCLLIPHHLAYRGPGGAGHDWSTHDPSVTRVAEIYSEHGASERDRGLHPMVRHSGPGRATANCVQAALARGLRFGFIASTDGHLGCPGAYPEGLVGVYAPELTRQAIWDALWNRQTIAVTGDRIDAQLHVNEVPQGGELPWTPERRIRVQVAGWDEIDKVELVKNNGVLERFYPSGASQASWPGRARCRIETGWGRWIGSGELALTHWKLSLEVAGATIRAAMPCLRSRPFLPDDRPGLKELTSTRCCWEAHTTQRYAVEGIQCFEDSNAQGMAVEIEGPPEAEVVLRVLEPEDKVIATTLAELAGSSKIEPLGPLAGGWAVLHRLVLPGEYGVQAEYLDHAAQATGPDYYYLRVTQANGQMAWTSPVWVEAAEESKHG